jgi:hypothetical protein
MGFVMTSILAWVRWTRAEFAMARAFLKAIATAMETPQMPLGFAEVAVKPTLTKMESAMTMEMTVVWGHWTNAVYAMGLEFPREIVIAMETNWTFWGIAAGSA